MSQISQSDFVQGLLSDKEIEDMGILELLMSIPQQEPSNDGPSSDDFIADLQRIAEKSTEDDLSGIFPDPSKSYGSRYKIKNL